MSNNEEEYSPEDIKLLFSKVKTDPKVKTEMSFLLSSAKGRTLFKQNPELKTKFGKNKKKNIKTIEVKHKVKEKQKKTVEDFDLSVLSSNVQTGQNVLMSKARKTVLSERKSNAMSLPKRKSSKTVLKSLNLTKLEQKNEIQSPGSRKVVKSIGSFRNEENSVVSGTVEASKESKKPLKKMNGPPIPNRTPSMLNRRKLSDKNFMMLPNPKEEPPLPRRTPDMVNRHLSDKPPIKLLVGEPPLPQRTPSMVAEADKPKVEFRMPPIPLRTPSVMKRKEDLVKMRILPLEPPPLPSQEKPQLRTDLLKMHSINLQRPNVPKKENKLSGLHFPVTSSTYPEDDERSGTPTGLSFFPSANFNEFGGSTRTFAPPNNDRQSTEESFHNPPPIMEEQVPQTQFRLSKDMKLKGLKPKKGKAYKAVMGTMKRFRKKKP